MHAILANHYLFGASYPRGGASEIAFHIIPVIEKAGGKVLVRAMVSKILVDENSGRVQGACPFIIRIIIIIIFFITFRLPPLLPLLARLCSKKNYEKP